MNSSAEQINGDSPLMSDAAVVAKERLLAGRGLSPFICGNHTL
jgi:hypothetical protein